MGTWPLKEIPYRDLMKRAGYIQGSENDSEILLLPGGADLGMRPERDKEEFRLWSKWVNEGKPIIGICRGMQVMLHLTGNDLIQHIPDETNLIQHTTINGSWLGQSSFHNTELGLLVNSRHHQGFKTVNELWKVIDKTEDNIIEAVINNKQFGVQWHPEHIEMIGTPAEEWWVEMVKTIL